MMVPLLDPVDGGVSAGEDTRRESVLCELWVSFISLIRSHLGALQTMGKLAQATFRPLSDAEFEVVDLARTLHISLQVASGEGEWSVTRMSEMIAAGTWVLRTDAHAAIDDGGMQDMELAVEGFLEKLWMRTPVAISDPGKEQPAI